MKLGNDNNKYVSLPDKNGRFRWVKKNTQKKSSTSHTKHNRKSNKPEKYNKPLKILRISTSARMPTSRLSQLKTVPKDWRTTDYFKKTRVWPNGTLPSLKKMGALGSGG